MKISRGIIAIFLLLTYSVGFASGVLPNCKEPTVAGALGSHHHHEHSGRSPIEHTNELPQYLVHEGHCDNGFLDLIICLISEVKASSFRCDLDQCMIPLKAKVSFKRLVKVVQIAAGHGAAQLAGHVAFLAVPSHVIVLLIRAFYDADTPLRGPPSISF